VPIGRFLSFVNDRFEIASKAEELARVHPCHFNASQELQSNPHAPSSSTTLRYSAQHQRSDRLFDCAFNDLYSPITDKMADTNADCTYQFLPSRLPPLLSLLAQREHSSRFRCAKDGQDELRARPIALMAFLILTMES
jgi:hypothetical protein